MPPSPVARRLAVAVRSGASAALRALPGSSQGFGPPRHYIPDTLEWSRRGIATASHAVAVRELTPGREVPRAQLLHADPPMAARLPGSGRAAIKPRYVAELQGGRYWGRGYGYTIDAADALHGALSPCLDDAPAPGAERVPVHDGLCQPWLPRVQEIGGTVAVLSTLFCENFHHWLLDCVPKFGLLREAGWDLAQIDRFVLPAGARHAWHREVLERLGVPGEKILPSTAQTHLRAPRLLVPSYSEPGREPEKYDYTPEGLALVRELFAASPADGSQPNWPERIVVSRERAAERRWLGGEVGYRRLAAAGFVKVLLEDHSLAVQAAYFRHARVIVMPTGGGLANLVHCSPGARVIELFHPAYLPTFSTGLCASLGLEYVALVAGTDAGPVAHSDTGGTADIAVSADRILQFLP